MHPTEGVVAMAEVGLVACKYKMPHTMPRQFLPSHREPRTLIDQSIDKG